MLFHPDPADASETAVKKTAGFGCAMMQVDFFFLLRVLKVDMFPGSSGEVDQPWLSHQLRRR